MEEEMEEENGNGNGDGDGDGDGIHVDCEAKIYPCGDGSLGWDPVTRPSWGATLFPIPGPFIIPLRKRTALRLHGRQAVHVGECILAIT
jgi:hypothetical protein